MQKKNKKIASLLKRKASLVKKHFEIDRLLQKIAAEEDRWSFSERGPFAYQWLRHLSDSLEKGKRPISLEEVQKNVEFDDPEKLKKYASEFGKKEAKRQKLMKDSEIEFGPTLGSEQV